MLSSNLTLLTLTIHPNNQQILYIIMDFSMPHTYTRFIRYFRFYRKATNNENMASLTHYY